MAAQSVAQPPLVARALRLLRISRFTPLALLLAAVTMTLDEATDLVYISVGTVIIGIVFTLIAPTSRDTPHIWGAGAVFSGIFVAYLFLMTALKSPNDRRLGLPAPMFTVVAVLLAVGVLLVSWLPARRAARLVLDDLPPDVVNSSLTIRFESRAGNTDSLYVTPHSLQIKRENSGKIARSYRLSDVSAVAVRIVKKEREYPVPDIEGRLVRVTPGEVVVIELPGGKLVFPAKDIQRFKQFLEERVRRATLEEEGRWL